MSVLLTLVGVVLVGYLPGAILLRLPSYSRADRGRLPAEERVFWGVLISLVWSIFTILILAAAGIYRYESLLLVNALLIFGAITHWGRRLLWQGLARKPTTSALLAVILLAMALWQFFPAAEYIIGGKDPGVYMNEGIQIERTGTLFRRDEAVRQVPDFARVLFFHDYGQPLYYSLRFMGMFLNDAATGEVISGWPHAFPSTVALGYRWFGAQGAVNTVGVWAALGLLAVWFFGSHLIGRLPAMAAAVLLALNLIEAWFGRYPTTEPMMQALLFSCLLAILHCHKSGDVLFAWVAVALVVLLVFVRVDSLLAAIAIAGAGAVTWIVSRRHPPVGPVLFLAVGGVAAYWYYDGQMRQYFELYRVNLPPLRSIGLGLGLGILPALAIYRWRSTIGPAVDAYLPLTLGLSLACLGVYALFFRQPGGRLTDYDAYGLRTFRDLYVYWPVTAAALVGWIAVTRRRFWDAPAFFLTLAAFSVFLFYKLHVVPEHWWMGRRFLPVILPGTLLLAAGAVFGQTAGERFASKRALLGLAFTIVVGVQFYSAASSVSQHVEYRGAVAHVDALARQFTSRDLLLVEGRDAASDFHVLAMPLAYAHGLSVLVLESPTPDRRIFRRFLDDALTKYERVFFLGGGGTDLLSQDVVAVPVTAAQFRLPEYETTPWQFLPRHAREKDLSYNLFRLVVGAYEHRGFSLDVGSWDDLNVVRFYARELIPSRCEVAALDCRTFRWTGPTSFVAVTGLSGSERWLTLDLQNGGRPPEAAPATVDVYFNGVMLGRLHVTEKFETYRLAIPADLVVRAALDFAPAQIRLISSLWIPSAVIGGHDTRQLGVMADRISVQ